MSVEAPKNGATLVVESTLDDRVSIKTSLPISFPNQKLAHHCLSFLSELEKINYNQTCRTAKEELDGLEALCWQMVRTRIMGECTADGEHPVVFITDKKGRKQDAILGLIGSGGSKKAFLLNDQRALLLPNLHAYINCGEQIEKISDLRKNFLRWKEGWKEQLKEEVLMSKFLTQIGLLSPLSEKVNLSFPLQAGSIPAYVSIAFEGLAAKGCYVIDSKNEDSSTWKYGKNFLFKEAADRKIAANWDSVMDTLLTDTAKIHFYGIPLGIDSVHTAITKMAEDPLKKSNYEVRFFGFDYSRRGGAINIKRYQRYISLAPRPDLDRASISDTIQEIFGRTFEHLFESELGRKEALDMYDFYSELDLKYANIIRERIELLKIEAKNR